MNSLVSKPRWDQILRISKWCMSSNSRSFCSEPDGGRSAEKVPSFSLSHVKKALRLSGRPLEESFNCLKTSCPICITDKDGKGASRPPVFLNKTSGDLICHKCQVTLKWESVEKFFSGASSARSRKELLAFQEAFSSSKPVPFDPASVVQSSQLVSTLPPDEISSILTDFSLTFLTPECLTASKCMFERPSRSLLFPVTDANKRTVGYRVLRPDGTETSLGNVSFGLAGVHKKSGSSTAVLVLGMMDVLALAAAKIPADIYCLPDSLRRLPQECLPVLERYQKLVLWFSYDTTGWDVAKNFAKKLDEKRCLLICPTDSHPTPFEALSRGLDLRSIYSKARPIQHKSITTFAVLRQDVLSDLQNFDKVQGVKWRRYASLNKFLKGHRKGELTVLTGPTGSGKTTFISEYSLDLAMQGVNTLWGSFEIRNSRLASTLLRQFAGIPLDENLGEFERFADEFEKLPFFFMTFHGQQAIKVVMEAIEHAQYVHDIHHVIIDNVQFMMGIAEEVKHMDRFWKQDAVVAAFRTFATKRNCHVTLVIHPRKEKDAEDLTTQSIFGGAKASQEADNVLIIQDKRLTSMRGKKYLQIAKNRYSGDLGIIPLEFDKASLSYAAKKKVKDKENKEEIK